MLKVAQECKQVVGVQALAAARPRWIDHMLLNEIFDGDMAYLAKASQYAKARAQGFAIGVLPSA